MDKRKNWKPMLLLLAVLLIIPTPTYASDGDFSLSNELSYIENVIKNAIWPEPTTLISASTAEDVDDGGNYDVGDAEQQRLINENLGPEINYTTANGNTIKVRKKLLAAKLKQLESVNALSKDDIDKAMLEINSMEKSDTAELVNIARAFADQASINDKYFNLSEEDVMALNNAYESTTWVSKNEKEEPEALTAEKAIDILTDGSLSDEEEKYAAMTGVLAAGALCGAAGAIKAAAKYKAMYEGKGRLGRSERYKENEAILEKSIPSTVKRWMNRAPVTGAAAYRVSNPIPLNLTYADQPLVNTIKNFISRTNGTWQGQQLEELAETIVSCSKAHNIDPLLITCQLKQESGFCPDASSPVGACGIAQFMPETAAGFGINPWNVAQAIDGQCTYMGNLMDSFGNYDLALAGYNAGGGAVVDYGYTIPPYTETQNYVDVITSAWGRLKSEYDLTGGKIAFA